MLLLYQLIVRLYLLGIRLAAPFVPKARQWVADRKELFRRLEAGIDPERPLIWIHCASLGEFEQGRPVLEGLRRQYPEHFLLLTFFSPSGYEIRKDTPLADLVSYLPGDTPARATRFVRLVRPRLVIFVKYEFWLFHLRALFKQQIPVLLISAVFRPGQLFFRSWGGPFRRLLPQFTQLFVQDQPSFELLKKHGLTRMSLNGDTRVDRVARQAGSGQADELVSRFARGHRVLIAGSSWPPDEELICRWINQQQQPGFRYILAPHDVSEGHLRQIEKKLQQPVHRYSRGTVPVGTDVLLIDNIGKLSMLYRYGHIAYIGGGFGEGIHNLLEPAAYGLPVLFGPRHQKFGEARALIRRGGGFCIRNYDELAGCLERLRDSQVYERASSENRRFILEQQGATQRILSYIDEHLNLD